MKSVDRKDGGLEMPKFAYFPGCSQHGTAKGYNKSVKSVCEALDIELWDIPDWSCCG